MVELVTIPAEQPAGLAVVEIREHGVTVGDADYRVCELCHLGVIEHVRVDPPFRRRGLATRAITKLLTDWPNYSWSTSPINDHRALCFWKSLDWPDPGTLGTPYACIHMRQSDDRIS
ncbi:GNAT family N-acetyltransferase [Saccharopolyspora elongata]|uniref:GNAT family N-acetyltransferase n=1 Tax=Saccharopolyspora elongata TaxID=2530387 RepID=UPI0014053474|nr:GNAT family N-acetyltransferase [Saccharopolyspora elongata]